MFLIWYEMSIVWFIKISLLRHALGLYRYAALSFGRRRQIPNSTPTPQKFHLSLPFSAVKATRCFKMAFYDLHIKLMISASRRLWGLQEEKKKKRKKEKPSA